MLRQRQVNLKPIDHVQDRVDSYMRKANLKLYQEGESNDIRLILDDHNELFTGTKEEVHENFTKKSKIIYKDGLKHGWYETWYPNEQKKELRHYFKGKREGQQYKWDQEGNIISDKTTKMLPVYVEKIPEQFIQSAKITQGVFGNVELREP